MRQARQLGLLFMFAVLSKQRMLFNRCKHVVTTSDITRFAVMLVIAKIEYERIVMLCASTIERWHPSNLWMI